MFSCVIQLIFLSLAKDSFMKKLTISLLIILLLGIVAVVTCPTRTAHEDAINAAIDKVIASYNREDDDDLGSLGTLASAFGAGIIKRGISSLLVVNNHFLWSTGVITDYSDENKRVSFGIFGHVFTSINDELKEELEDWQ